MKISLIGSGRWASNIAGLCLKNNHTVLCWERDINDDSQFFKHAKNEYINLSAYKKCGQLTFTHNLKKAIKYGDFVIISILSQKLDELMEKIKLVPNFSNKNYCLAMKGVQAETGRTLSEIMRDAGVDKNNIVVMAGPGHIQSILAGKKTHMIVAGYNYNLAEDFKKIIVNKSFKLFLSTDVKGVELCAAAKNVYGGLAGICVGSGNNTLRGSLMCASLSEMEQYLEAMQCITKTARGLSLLGDYDATMYDSNSHNLNFGIEIVKQNTIHPQLNFSSVEGRDAVSGLIKRMENFNAQVSDKMQLKAPLMEVYNQILLGKIAPNRAVNQIEKAINEVYKLEENTYKLN